MKPPLTDSVESCHPLEHSQGSAGRGMRLLRRISDSALFQTYQAAFWEVTGLALHLASPDGEVLQGNGPPHRNALCGQLNPHHAACGECSRMWRKMAALAGDGARHFQCFAGLCESCVPIRSGTQTLGLLIAGGVATRRPTRSKLKGILARLREGVHDIDKARLRNACVATQTVTRRHYESSVRLLEIFADQLSLVASHLALDDRECPDPAIRRARTFIHAHLSEPLELASVARCAGLSRSYFSTRFKESTGLAFTEYVAAARVEAARNMLANPGLRVSEIAFAVGFQSLTRFNRVFREMTGMSPTCFRKLHPEDLGTDHE